MTTKTKIGEMYVIWNGIWQHVCNSASLRSQKQGRKIVYHPTPFVFLMKVTSLGKTGVGSLFHWDIR